MTELSHLIAALLALIGPPPKDCPTHLQLKAGDQIVAIGDSITQQGGYLRNVDAVLATQYPGLRLPKIINAGIPSQKAEDLAARFQKDVLAKQPQWVTINVGINDAWQRLEQPPSDEALKNYTGNVTSMVEMAQAAGIKVILLTPTLIYEDPASKGNVRLQAYAEALKKIAKKKKCGVVDLHSMFLTALADKPTDAKEGYLTTEGIHMNPRGDALIAIGILRQLGISEQQITAADATKVKRRN